jgi:hypothetical protein
MTHSIVAKLKAHRCHLAVGAGIVNPMGPTLTALLVQENDLVRISLNPFQQQFERLRAAKPEEAEMPSKLVAEVGTGLACAPTILLFAGASASEIAKSARLFAEGSDDLAGLVDALVQYFGNPWDRVSAEMDAAVQAVLKPEALQHRPETPEDAETYLRLILDPRHITEEIAAFKYAWKGSIEFQKSNGNLRMASTAMPESALQEALLILLGRS